MGAIASGGVCVLNRDAISSMRIPDHVIERVAAGERRELERREQVYRGSRPQPEIAGKTVILVDDGVATGSTMLAALEALRKKLPAHLVVAVPVASESASQALESAADEFVAGLVPEMFFGVGHWYADFSQTTDAEVRVLLEKSHLQRTVLPRAKAA
jgi:predicted phosphoribosyltransferase